MGEREGGLYRKRVVRAFMTEEGLYSLCRFLCVIAFIDTKQVFERGAAEEKTGGDRSQIWTLHAFAEPV